MRYPSAMTVAVILLHVDSVARAQTDIPAGISSPTYSMLDANGVNLVSNRPSVSIADVSIGEKARSLGHVIASIDYSDGPLSIQFIDNYYSFVRYPQGSDTSQQCAVGQVTEDVVVAGVAERMCGIGGVFTSQRGNGTSMVTNVDGSLTYTEKDGTTMLFGVPQAPTNWKLARITAPDGRITTLNYRGAVSSGVTYYRVQSITRNDGLQLKYRYATDTIPTSGSTFIWFQVASVTALNNVIDYCDPVADICSFTQPWPIATQTWTPLGNPQYLTVVDAGGASTRFTMGIPVLSGGLYSPSGPVPYIANQLLAIKAPTSATADTTIFTYCAVASEYNCMHSGVKKVNSAGFDWTYTGTSGSGGVSLFINLTGSRPDGGGWLTSQQQGNYSAGPLLQFNDGINAKTYNFDTSLANRVWRVDSADGDSLSYLWDSRGNITQETHTPVSGSTLNPIIRLASYDTTCANPVKCNKPNWVKDANGNETDYTYDPTHGGVLTVTAPADANGIRPQTRYGYVQRYAWYKNSSGTVVQAATPIWILASEKYCRTTAVNANGVGCTTAADEVVTTYEYGPTSGANNLFLRGKAILADGVTLRTCFGYDIYGNRISETTPNAGLTSCP